MPKQRYEYLEHTADAKFQAFGSSLDDSFKNAAFAMLNLICNTDKVKAKREKRVIVKGKDLKALLYNWLEEFLFLLDSENFLTSNIRNLKICGKKKDYKLEATVLGDNVANYETFGEVKAVTYNSMFIKKEKDKVTVQVVVDM